MHKEPLYPHVSKRRQPQFPHVPKGQQPVEKIPQTLPHTGTCYRDAWRFLIKEGEGELIHGTLFSGGRRMGHAWVETLTGWVWEPETGKFFTASGFKDAYAPVIDARYNAEEAAIMAARTNNLGPWSEQERLEYLGVRQPETIALSTKPRKQTFMKIECMYCHKYMGEKPGYGVTGITSSICRECWTARWPNMPYPEDEKEEEHYFRQRLPQTDVVTVTCPICKKVIEIPEYNDVTRTEALTKHLNEEHLKHPLLAQLTI